MARGCRIGPTRAPACDKWIYDLSSERLGLSGCLQAFYAHDPVQSEYGSKHVQFAQRCLGVKEGHDLRTRSPHKSIQKQASRSSSSSSGSEGGSGILWLWLYLWLR